MAQHILTYKDKALEKNGGLVSLTLNIDPTLENNTWDTIAKAFKLGLAPSGWLGQTKEITSGTYNGYHLQLVDNTKNRYERVDGNGYTKAVFMFVKLLPNFYTMNSTATNVGGWKDSALRTTLNSTIYNDLPSDLKKVIAECVVKGGNGDYSDQAVNESNNKLFIPCQYEITGDTYSLTHTKGAEEGSPRYTYYVGKGQSDYIKIGQGNTARNWWLRTTYFDSSENKFVGFDYKGAIPQYEANTNIWVGVCPAFAI